MNREVVRHLGELLWRFAVLDQYREDDGRLYHHAYEHRALEWSLRQFASLYPSEYKVAMQRVQERWVNRKQPED